MNWEVGQIVTVNGQLYKVEKVSDGEISLVHHEFSIPSIISPEDRKLTIRSANETLIKGERGAVELKISSPNSLVMITVNAKQLIDVLEAARRSD